MVGRSSLLLCLLLVVVVESLGSASMVGQSSIPFPEASAAPQVYGIANFFTNTPGPRSVLSTVAINLASGEIAPVMDNMITLNAKDSIPSDFLAALDKQHGVYSWSDGPYTTLRSNNLACKEVQSPLDVIRVLGASGMYSVRFRRFVQDDVSNQLYIAGTCRAGSASLCIGRRLPDRYQPVIILPNKYDTDSDVGAAIDVATNRFFLIAHMAETPDHVVITISLTSSSVLSDVTIAAECRVAPHYSWYDPATRILFGVASFAGNASEFWILRIDPTTGGCTKTRMNIPATVGSVVTSSWTFDDSSNQLWFSSGSTAAGNFLLAFDIRRGAISNVLRLKGLQTPLLNVAVGPASWKCDSSFHGELAPTTGAASPARLYGASFNGPADAMAPKVYSIDSASGDMSFVSPNGIFQTDIVHMRVGNSAFDQKGGRYFSVPFGAINSIFTTDVTKKVLLTPMRYADARADRMVYNNVNNHLYSLYITSTGELFLGVIGITDFRPALRIPSEYNGATAQKCLGIDDSKGIIFLAISKGNDPLYYILSISIQNWQIIRAQQLDVSSCGGNLVPFYLYYDKTRADLIMGTTNIPSGPLPTVLRVNPLTGRCSGDTRISFPGGGRSVYAYSYDNTTDTLWFASNADVLYSFDMNSGKLHWVSCNCPNCRNFVGTVSLEVSHNH